MFNKALETVMGAASSKIRLVVEYVLVGLLVASLGLSASLYIGKLKQDTIVSNLRSKVQSLSSEVEGLKVVNNAHRMDIQELKELRYIDAETLGKMIGQLKVLSDNDADFRARLARLGAQDESVRNYLANDIPPLLRCVLNGTCEQPPGGMPKGGTGTPQPSGKTAGPDTRG